jgi:hypothetical protein
MKTKLLAAIILLHLGAYAQWENIFSFQNSPYSLLTVNDDLYAGLSGGGVYHSGDGGLSWTAVNNGIQFGGAYVFSMLHHNDSLFAGVFGDVYFSGDFGANWTSLNLNLDLNDYVYDLLVKDDFLYAGVGHGPSNGVYRKLLREAEWEVLIEGLPENASVNALMTAEDFLFAGTDQGLFKSADNGSAWEWSGEGMEEGLAVKSLASISTNILAGTSNGIYVSVDVGNTWSASLGMPENSVGVCLTGNDEYAIAGTYQSAWYSPDFGFNWIQISNGLDSIVSFYSLATMGDYIYAGTGAGITTTNTVFKFKYNTLSSASNFAGRDLQAYVYPNPFSQHTSIYFAENLQNAGLQLYNLMGQQVASMSNINGSEVILKRNELPAGIYLLRITQGFQTIFTQKVIISGR